jgi:hypothetical protein
MRLPALSIIVFAILANIQTAAGSSAIAGQPSPSTIILDVPLRFGKDFQDDPRRLAAGAGWAAGLPAFDSRGTSYYRYEEKIIKRYPNGNAEVMDFESSMAAAIDKLLCPRTWDRHWEASPVVDQKLVIDSHDNIYTVVTPKLSNLTNPVLLFSRDGARTWTAFRLLGLSAAVEGRDGYNNPTVPPSVLSFDTYGSQAGTNLWLHVFRLDGAGNLERAHEAHVSGKSLLSPNHSGGANSAFTFGSKIFIVYPSAAPPARGAPGTEILARQFDRQRLAFEGGTVSLGIAGDLSNFKSGPNPHHIPAITVDRVGGILVFFGAHQGRLKYTESRRAATIHGGWKAPVAFGEPLSRLYGSYTYLSVSMNRAQTVHVFSRYAGDLYKFQLVHMVKPYGQGFRRWPDGKQHRVLVDPGRTMYATYHQQSTMDRSGNVYLFFDYWPNQLTDQEAGILDVLDAPRLECANGRCWFHHRRYLRPTTLMLNQQSYAVRLLFSGN